MGASSGVFRRTEGQSRELPKWWSPASVAVGLLARDARRIAVRVSIMVTRTVLLGAPAHKRSPSQAAKVQY